jgi:hypothetical protein
VVVCGRSQAAHSKSSVRWKLLHKEEGELLSHISFTVNDI